MGIITLVLLVIAFLCFVAAAFNATAKVNLIGIGLAAWVFTLILSGGAGMR